MESRVIRNPAAQQISFNPRPAWTYPDSLMGVISYIRQTLMDAQQHAAAHAIYDKNPAGYKRPDESPSLDALGGVLRRDVPVVFVADSDLMMRRAEAIAKEFNVRMIIAGARQGYRMADELKARSAAAGFDEMARGANIEGRSRRNSRCASSATASSRRPPRPFWRRTASSSRSSAAREERRLSPRHPQGHRERPSADDALKATTINPAKIIGIDRQLGSRAR
jgi:hypothetical protein